MPDLDKLVKLCEIFEVSLDELVGRESPKEKTEEAPTPSPQVIVQQVPAKDSFFTVNKIIGCVLLLAAVFATLLTRSGRIMVMTSSPLYLLAMSNLTEFREPWYGYAFFIYFWKMEEISMLIDMWIGADSSTEKIAWIIIAIVISVVTCIIAVRFCKKRTTEAFVSAKINCVVFVALGWLVHLACIVLYALNTAEMVAIWNKNLWLFVSLCSCVLMVYYTTAFLVYRKKIK